MLPLVILDHLQRLAPAGHHQRVISMPNHLHSRVHDVPMREGGALRNLLQTNLILAVDQQFDNLLLPVCPIRQQSQVRQWFLRTAEFAFHLGQFV